MNDELKQALKYIKENVALFTFLSWFAGISGKLFIGFYQSGYISYFNVSINEIDIMNSKILFELPVYSVVAAFLLLINFIGYEFYKRHKLFFYLAGVGITFFVCCLGFVLALSDTIFPLVNTLRAIADMFVFSVLLTIILNCMVLSYACFPSNKDKIENIEFKLKKNIDKKKRIKLENTLVTLKEKEELYNSGDEKTAPLMDTWKILLFMVCLMFIAAFVIGYIQADSKTEFKTVSNEYIELKSDNYRDGFAMVFKTGEKYIAVPYENNNDGIELYVNEQIKISEDNVFIVEKDFEKAMIKQSY